MKTYEVHEVFPDGHDHLRFLCTSMAQAEAACVDWQKRIVIRGTTSPSYYGKPIWLGPDGARENRGYDLPVHGPSPIA